MSQVTLREQLRDPLFKKWFCTPPVKEEIWEGHTSTPWRIYVQEVEGGPWKKAEVKSWRQGYKFLAKNLKKFHDIALSHKRIEYRPPVVRNKKTQKKEYHYPPTEESYLPDAPQHHWCGYCRRMTLFQFFSKHHAMPRCTNPKERMCSICGVRLAFLRRY